MLKTFSEVFYKELVEIKSSYYKLFLLTLFPLLSFSLLIAIFYAGVLRDLPIAVVDHDKSKLSRLLLTNIESSPTIEISHMPSSTKDAIVLTKSSKVYGVLVIPQNFQKDTLLQKNPKVTAMLNTQYILVGKILTSAITSVVMQSAGQIDYVNNLVDLKNPHATINSVSPINMQVTPFFNIYQNYFYFLISALLPAIWQIFIVVATLVSFGSMFKAKKESSFLNSRHPKSISSLSLTADVGISIIAKLMPYTFVYLLWGITYLFFIYGTLGWIFEGSLLITIFGMFLTVIAYQGVALLFFVTGFDYARSLSLGAVYTAPAFAFLGITFPVYSMNGFALFWRDLLPISHYMELQISQANYGADIYLEIGKLLTLFAFWIVFIPVIYMFKRRLAL